MIRRMIFVGFLVGSFVGCAKKPVVVIEQPAPVVFPTNPKAVRLDPRVKNVMFHFDSDSVTVSNVRRITKDCLTHPGPRVLTGSASNERSGKYTEKASKAYNLTLSTKRAQAVQTAYTLAGCLDSRVEYIGETDKFGALEKNRRVTVKGE